MAAKLVLIACALVIAACARKEAGMAITWQDQPNALQDAQGQPLVAGTPVAVTCPPNGAVDTVWGTDVYTDDSSICTAAVHAGLITFERGGPVVFEIVDGRQAYPGSERNGVTTSDYGPWSGSFVFMREAD
jgi:LCCL domain-containing protein